MTEWLYEKKIIDLGSFHFYCTHISMGLWMREIERKGNMFPQRVLGDSFNVYLRLLLKV